MGLMQRRKGKAFELVVRDHLRHHLDHPVFQVDGRSTLVIRRTSQADRAWEADLIIEACNAPDWLLNCWVECEHANDPDPWAKLAQARRDAAAATLRSGRQRTPVVVWRRTGSRVIWLSTSLSWLNELLTGGDQGANDPGHGILVTARLDEVLPKLRARL